ncbi:ABC transporter permease [Roseicyclus mahoneyensis]|uniref:ABC-type nitrate/sulfonate/bicarbonate transport system permease component n=1 Tax=Roseicyclus mahoneyensis TaxID=164332 RepID=A0A316GP71_9RHOB|nr:ABC transporter permease subunit [Roseicyclus mahoneyensis]PWK62947.1 ABC-type nitrate/sulfonate/bicarbonate transport system permease component [Roseicyclus mahoneyensis]
MSAVAGYAAPATGGSGRGTAIGLLLVVLGWELAARALVGAFVLAAPSQVLAWLIENRGLMGRALAETLGNAAAGFVLGNLAALALAGIALAFPASQRIVTGVALVVFCLPLVATGPILRVIFGPGDGPQIVLAALAVYYTTLIPLLVGMRAAPATWFDLIASYGRGRVSALIHVRLMASLPYLFAGLQIAAPAAFLGAMVGEFTGAERGMGVLTIRAMRALDVEMTWALATVATAVAVAAYLAVGAIARRVLQDAPPIILAPPRAEGAEAGIGRLLLSLAGVAVAILVLWWGAIAVFDLNPFFAKGPQDVARALIWAPNAAMARASLGAALGETAVFLLPGYLAGLAAGAGLAILFVLAPAVAGTAMPLAIALRSVPIVTTAPLIVLLLGRGALGTIVLVAVMVFFPTLVACIHGLKQAPGQVIDVFDSYAAGRLQRLIRVRIPAMLPAFFAAARMGVPASVLAVTVVEWLATGAGLGSMMAISASVSDYNLLWSAVALTAALSALGYAGVGLIEVRILRIYAPEQLT